ncbi:Putative transcription elongation factor 1 [Septoria linicola]|uniref:Transcription elongation factor 1 homolog n=1 Tax=Septoria linicola TaxID=215465 RepID=A0A9Q9AVH9_9PEZI|nr:putative transcription elongation factor 1 [Septoria linicola]USW51461.1 Putative transcription elongation factor 1 [Septoria linicola]
MGKRKAAKREGPKKKREALATSFKCVFCNHETSVSVKIDKKIGVGNLSCKSCGQSFQTSTNYLSSAVDVYSDWIDACEAVAKKETATDGPPSSMRQSQTVGASRAGLAPGERMTDEDAGFIDDDDADAEEDYGAD